MFFSKRALLILFGIGVTFSFIIFGVIRDNYKDYYSFPKVKKSVDVNTTDLSSKAIKRDSTFVNYSIGKEHHEGRTSFENKVMTIDESFTSNLPIVVLDTNGVMPEKGDAWDSEKGYAVWVAEDPYVQGEMKIINTSGSVNRLTDKEEISTKLKMRVRGNSSSSYDKKQWLVKLLDDEGKSHKENLLNLGNESEWVLNVSFVDKSLMRNYIAYQAANEIMGYAPHSEYCEVVWKNKDEYQYQGVYLLMHSIKVGKNRVNIPSYSENGKYIPALLRRDRYSDTDVMLKNYATINGYTYGHIGIIYPDKELTTEKVVKKITNNINEFEEALYSNEYEEFIKYRKYADLLSFVDYFIINEYFMNYDAGYHSTYFYTDYSGKIHMGPVWDFDQGYDNAKTQAAALFTTAFHDAPWFKEMLKDPEFTALIINRYSELRKSILSDESIYRYALAARRYLGSAVDRDWARWGYYYSDDDNLKALSSDGESRNTYSQDQELSRMLSAVSTHAAWMDENLDSLYQFKMISLEDAVYIDESKHNYRGLMAVIFVLVFGLSAQLVSHFDSQI